MKKFRNFIVGFIVCDYLRIALLRSYHVIMRQKQKGQTLSEALKKTAPSWRDCVILSDEKEETE